MAAALSSSDSGTDSDTGGELEEKSLFILKNLAGRVESRLRVVDREGRMIADSAVLGPRTHVLPENPKLHSQGSLPEEYTREVERSVREAPLYQIVVPPLRRIIDFFALPEVPITSAESSGRCW